MPLLGTILASCRIKQANRNVNTLLYPRPLNWSGKGQASLGFGFIWLCMNGNSKQSTLPALFRDYLLSLSCCCCFSTSPSLVEASWCNGVGGRSGARRQGTYSQLFSPFCLVSLGCFCLYHSQHQQALILFELSRCSSNANKS